MQDAKFIKSPGFPIHVGTQATIQQTLSSHAQAVAQRVTSNTLFAGDAQSMHLPNPYRPAPQGTGFWQRFLSGRSRPGAGGPIMTPLDRATGGNGQFRNFMDLSRS